MIFFFLKITFVPAYLTHGEEELYKQKLEEQAYPIEDKSTDSFTRLLTMARKLKIENKWKVKARGYLAQFNEEYAKRFGKESYLYNLTRIVEVQLPKAP